MITVLVRTGGRTTSTDRVDREWLRPDSAAAFWLDLANPTPDESLILHDLFRFHPLSIEDALSETHHPKIEAYDGYLYVILHGIDFQASQRSFTTRDVDFFLTERYLVTVHSGESRSISEVRHQCLRNDDILKDGAPALMHRIVDAMVDNYRPEIDELEERMDALEHQVFTGPPHGMIRTILSVKKEIVSLRQVVLPQRDVLGRLARREFGLITPQVAYGFRDVYDHVVRMADEALMFQDRTTTLVEAHLSSVNNQLNSVMKILTVIATIFMPLTFITGLFGMNVDVPDFGFGSHATFWILLSMMGGLATLMLLWFRRNRWL